ncbi:MAG: L,D-transpeptidase family protein [Alphaproteobacteria bacterium]|nr:L,D-transpeptidase family protein [Alphaproteobacteria bacterium]
MTDLVTDGRRLVLPNGEDVPCSMGRSGLISAPDKREGDGATPIGRWRLLQVYYRPDRMVDPVITKLPSRPLSPQDGWCDAPDDLAYNQFVQRPYAASHEEMWRQDGLYDIVVTTDHNTDPAVPGMGSAIFLHCRHETGKPTAGCIAVDKAVLHQILKELDADSWLVIQESL